MSNVPEEPDVEGVALIKKLDPAPQRDPQTAAAGRSKFLAEARNYRASVSAAHEQRRMGWKENTMRRWRIPTPVVVLVVMGLAIFVVGRVFLSARMLMSARAPSSSPGAEIFVAGQNIPQGARITEDELATISLPQDRVSAVEFAAVEKSKLVGKVAKYPLEQGVVITESMVTESSNAPAIMAGPEWVGPTTHSGLHLGATQTPPTMTNPQPAGGAPIPVSPSTGYAGQMVIKNGDIRLLVKDTDRALEGVTQVVTGTQGYVLTSRVWYQDYFGTNYKYAVLTIGVAADQFDNALSRLRSLGIRVLDENASGEDVTGQYVDLQSQLTNLEATRDRIRSFLDQTTTVDEALRVNQQLSEVESQIERIKGQMNYLSGRSAFSMITISLEPELPKITPTPAATPTPVSALGPWDAGATTEAATHTLVFAYRLIASFLIWFFVVIVPVLGPPILLVWLVVRLIRRRKTAGAKEQAV